MDSRLFLFPLLSDDGVIDDYWAFVDSSGSVIVDGREVGCADSGSLEV